MYIILKLFNNIKIFNIKIINIFSIINYFIEDCFLMERTIDNKIKPVIDTKELTYQDLIREEQKKEKYIKKNVYVLENKQNVPIIKYNSCENLKKLEKYNSTIINRNVKIIELMENDKVEYCKEEGFLGQYVLFI